MNLQQHPLSSAWPAMQADEYQSLKDSIEVIGIQNPITIFEGMVIDGWHRYSACTELGIHCPSKLLGDVDPIDFVKSQNEARRNVTASQRALAISAIYAWKPHGDQRSAPGADRGKSTTELANLAGVGTRTMEQAKAVESKATPEVKAAVRAGKMSVKKAAETIKPKKPAKVKPKPEPTPEPKEYAPDGEPVEEYTEIDDLKYQIGDLHAALAVKSMTSESSEEQTMAADLIASLRKEIKDLTINIEAVTRSRDQFQNEAAEAKKLCKSLQNQIKRLKA